MRISIRGKLSLVMLLLLGPVLVAAGFWAWDHAKIYRQFDHSLRHVADRDEHWSRIMALARRGEPDRIAASLPAFQRSRPEVTVELPLITGARARDTILIGLALISAKILREGQNTPNGSQTIAVLAGEYQALTTLIQHATRDSTVQAHPNPGDAAIEAQEANAALKLLFDTTWRPETAQSVDQGANYEAFRRTIPAFIESLDRYGATASQYDAALLLAGRDRMLWRILIVTGVLCCAVTLISWLVWSTRSALRRGFAGLDEIVTTLSTAPIEARATALDGHDEFAKIAAGISAFRDQTITRVSEALARRRMSEDQAREALLATLDDTFGTVLEQAAAGDLSARVPENSEHDAVNRLAERTNILIASVSAGVAETTTALSRVAAFDLGGPVADTRPGAFHDSRHAFNTMIASLRQAFEHLESEIAALNTHIEHLDHDADALFPLDAVCGRSRFEPAIRDLLEHAHAGADQLSGTRTAHETLREGVKAGLIAVQASAESVGATGAATRQFSDFGAQIDRIAKNAHLVAVNASVEAARAGEAGKGFAIVAQAVEAMAETSTRISRDFAKQINVAVAQIAEGEDALHRTTARLQGLDGATRTTQDAAARLSESHAASVETLTDLNQQCSDAGSADSTLLPMRQKAVRRIAEMRDRVGRLNRVFHALLGDKGTRDSAGSVDHNASDPVPRSHAS